MIFLLLLWVATSIPKFEVSSICLSWVMACG